jgi:hypothetical protein
MRRFVERKNAWTASRGALGRAAWPRSWARVSLMANRRCDNNRSSQFLPTREASCIVNFCATVPSARAWLPVRWHFSATAAGGGQHRRRPVHSTLGPPGPQPPARGSTHKRAGLDAGATRTARTPSLRKASVRYALLRALATTVFAISQAQPAIVYRHNSAIAIGRMADIPPANQPQKGGIQ